ncbi:ATP-dependent Clp protease ATP-binding subunit [Gulosibacter molinativorax]|uniref:ATP-dependent Clp protease ATP-binding subunit n=1 Tax=Gulosibacter molinativorax TaxID=256821 RepID=A0ABT7CAD9_9MICO|nr:ATP-dependent Clp protease ATP-binding subunit [Gulosibacter molinativorax]MDJ1371727.1 ATP-dependent Clp protease ATP-binding subunit [Gulosibacter molinativorax]QUY63149.1 Putative ATP-dependent Clp protease ATP-binding subunit ClpC [Gulosibacter molinativorax]
MPTFFGPNGSQDGSFDEFLSRYLQGRGSGRSGRSVDMSRLLSKRSHALVNQAVKYALEHGHTEVDALHLLRVIILDESIAPYVKQLGADPQSIADAADQRLPESSDRQVENPSFTGSAQRTLLDGYQAARAFGSTYVDPEHLFFALVMNHDSPAGQILAAAGITQDSLQAGAQAQAQAGADAQGESGAPAGQEGSVLEKFGLDLTAEAREGKLDPVIGRAREIEQTIEILARRTKNNPVLIGEAGVGKTAIAEGLAQAIAADEVPAQLKGKRVISLDLAGMLAGTRYRGDFEERLTGAIDEIAADGGNTIVFIDELHTVVGAGGSGESGAMDAGNILKPRLARGELHLVGATTLSEFRKIEKDAALARRFQPVMIGEPGIEDAVRILEGLQGQYAKHHGVTYTPEALRAAVELSDRYISDRFLPDKAIDLIDQAGARLSLRRGPVVDVEALRARLGELEADKRAAIESEDFERAGKVRDQIAEVTHELDVATQHGQAAGKASGTDSRTVDEQQIAEVVARATGIPAASLTESEKTRLARLEEQLHARVVGQDDAVTAVAKAVRRNRTGMGDPSRPVGSFLVLGPTGVGKTELAKALAEALFDDESAMVRFDMSEFGERHTVSRLVGAPPGYVGYDEAGQLTERVRRRPYSVVLLDEIEKAHPDVFNLLLQVLDDGRLTDGQGRTVDFRNTVIIMTSNLGSEFIAAKGAPLGFATGRSEDADRDMRQKVMGKLREAMRPEFLNRIDDTVLFRKLEPEQLQDIARLQLGKSIARLASQGIALHIDDAAVAWIAEEGYEPEFGARPLRRVIQRELDDRVADLLVNEEVDEGGAIDVSVDAEGHLRVSARREMIAA